MISSLLFDFQSLATHTTMRLGIPVALLRVICFALELYSSTTPNRFKKVRAYVSARLEESSTLSTTPICEVWLC